MRFIHLSDVHLGMMPDRGTLWSEARAEEIWESFRRVIAAIRKDPVDFLFIAGDLFHRQPLLRELREVNYLFSQIPETTVYLMAGNHDYMKRDSFYRSFVWEENVVFFQSEKISCVKDKKHDVYVYGLSYENQEIFEPLYDDVKPNGEAGYHVLLAHGGDTRHIPMNIRSINQAGFDYTALGHIHKPQMIFHDKMAYAGALEPTDCNDTGPHGYIEGTMEDGKVTAKFVSFSCRTYQQIILTVREDSTQFSLEEMLRTDIMNRGGKNIYRVVLQGYRNPELLLIPEKLRKQGNIIDIIDESQPMYDLDALQKRYAGTMIGEYISYFRRKECSAVEKKALYYGLQALLQTSR